MLANVCGKFTGLNLGIQIVFVYEIIETKVRDAGPLGLFGGAGKVVSYPRFSSTMSLY